MAFTLSLDPRIFIFNETFAVQWYGIWVVAGIILFLYNTWNNPLRIKNITQELYEKLLLGCITFGLLGARIVHLMSEWHSYHSIGQMLAIWNGGLSILGAVLGIALFAPWYLHKNHVPVLPILDLGGLYIPLTQAVSRIGCLFAGCCFGCASDIPWAVIYTSAQSSAPLFTALHPTQLYSSFVYLGIFLFLRYKSFYWNLQAGQLAMLYLMLSSAERFFIDFLRDDRIINSSDSLIFSTFLSMHQWLSIVIFCTSCMIFIYINSKNKHIGNKNR